MCGIFMTLLGKGVTHLTFSFNLYQVMAESHYGQKETLEQFHLHMADNNLLIDQLDLAVMRDKIARRGGDSVRVFRQQLTGEVV